MRSSAISRRRRARSNAPRRAPMTRGCWRACARRSSRWRSGEGTSRARRRRRARRPTSSRASATRATQRCSGSCWRARTCCSAGWARRVARWAKRSPATWPADVRAVASLAEAEIAARALAGDGGEGRPRSRAPRAPLRAAPVLARELARLDAELATPIARLEHRGETRDADLFADRRGVPRRAAPRRRVSPPRPRGSRARAAGDAAGALRAAARISRAPRRRRSRATRSPRARSTRRR